MRTATASLIIFLLCACARASVASEADRTAVFVKHSVLLTDKVVDKFRVRLRIAAVLVACEQEDLSRKVRIRPEAETAEFKAYILESAEAASLGEQLLASLRIGLAYYMTGVIDTSRAHILGRPHQEDSFCGSAADAANLLQAP